MTDDPLSTQDIPTDSPGLHLFAQLGVAIETLNGNLKRQFDQEQARLAAQSINMPFQQIVNTAAAFDIKDFLGPQPGRQWIVRLLSAFADPVGANAATVSWYVGQVMPGSANGQLPLNMKRWEFTALPGEATFTSNVITIRNGERLIAGVTGIPASSRIYLNATVNDEPLWGARTIVSPQ